MLTQCPNCSTNFRVSPAQLKARAGKVRCGQCNFVFNALETLVDDLVIVQAITAAPAQEPVEQFAETEPACEPTPEKTGATVEIEIDETKTVPDEITVEKTGAIEAEAETGTDKDIAEPLPEPAVADPERPEDYLGEPLLKQPAAATRRWPWLIGSIIAVLGLLAQAVYYYRVELAVLRPDLRPLLQALCEPVYCEVPRPRSIDTLGIDASDLRPDPQWPGHLTLSATLRSKAVYAQEWPLLELTLTDVEDHKLAVKHFAAGDYLPKDSGKDKRIEAGFPANGEIAVTLPLDVGNLPASGYRLYIFYP